MVWLMKLEKWLEWSYLTNKHLTNTGKTFSLNLVFFPNALNNFSNASDSQWKNPNGFTIALLNGFSAYLTDKY